MAKPPKVSVNLCCYNSERYLEETLESVFGQTFQDFELVIVNDGSRDSTDSIIRRHMAAGRPIVYHPQANGGLGAARNKALELSRGEFIALIDHDDVWEPRKLEKVVPLFARPEVAFAGSDAARMDAAGRFLNLSSSASPLCRGRVLRELFLYNFIICATAVLRRTAIAAAGGFFRPDFRNAEEYELFLRLAEQGEFDFVPEPLVRIRIHAANASWDVLRNLEESRQIYAQCLGRNPGLAKALGPRIVAVKSAGFNVPPRMEPAFAGRGPLTLRLKAGAQTFLTYFPWLMGFLLRLKRDIARWESGCGAKIIESLR